MPNISNLVQAFQIPLVRLAMLMAQGQGNSSEAIALRDDLADLESQMQADEVAVARNLSSDLYMIEDDEVFDDPSAEFSTPEALGQAIYVAYHGKKWDRTLALLRQEAPFLGQSVRAYLRGRAYESAGFFAAAWAFYSDAARRDQDRVVYDYMALSALARWNPDLAKRQAEGHLHDANTHLALRLLSAATILQYYRDNIEEHRDIALELARSILPMIGEAAMRQDVPKEVLASGYASLSVCLEVLQDYANAAVVLRILDSLSPHIMQKRFIAQFEALTRQGRSRNAGVLVNLTDMEVPPRPDTFEESLDANVASALLVTA